MNLTRAELNHQTVPLICYWQELWTYKSDWARLSAKLRLICGESHILIIRSTAHINLCAVLYCDAPFCAYPNRS
jgi:hypothetical protein